MQCSYGMTAWFVLLYPHCSLNLHCANVLCKQNKVIYKSLIGIHPKYTQYTQKYKHNIFVFAPIFTS